MGANSAVEGVSTQLSKSTTLTSIQTSMTLPSTRPRRRNLTTLITLITLTTPRNRTSLTSRTSLPSLANLTNLERVNQSQLTAISNCCTFHRTTIISSSISFLTLSS